MSSILRSTIIVAIFSILAKITGLVKFIVLSNRFGAGRETDIYFAAFRVPDFIFNLLIAGTLSVAFIPVFVQYVARDRRQAFAVASSIFNLTMLVMGVFGFIGILAAPWLMRLIAPGFDSGAQAETVTLTRILMFSPLIFSLSSILTSILHSFKRFYLAATGPIFYNLLIIFGIVYLHPRYGFVGVVWAVVAGALLHFVLQLPASLRLGLRPLQHLALDHPAVKAIGKLFVPRILGIDLGQVSLLASSVIGSFLAVGSIARYNYAYDLETLPLGIFAIAFAVTAFPVMSGFAAQKDFDGFRKFLSKTMVQLLFLIIPISVLMLVLRAQIVRLLFGALQGTKFTFEDTRITAAALGFFALSLFAQSLIPLLARGFYALHNTIVPVTVGVLAATLNLVLSYVLTRQHGVETMALAFSVAAIFDAVMLFVLLRKHLGRDLDDDVLIVRLLKICTASVAAGIAAYAALYLIAPFVNMQTYAGVFLQGAGAASIGVLAYFVAGILAKLQEAREFIAVLKSWFTKFSRPVVAVVENIINDLRLG